MKSCKAIVLPVVYIGLIVWGSHILITRAGVEAATVAVGVLCSIVAARVLGDLLYENRALPPE